MTTKPDRPARRRSGSGSTGSGRTGTGRPVSSAPRVPFALLVGGLLVGGLVLLLALNTGSAANELRRSALATKDQEVSADVAQLRNEVAASAAPANLAGAAQQLGMVPAAHPAFIIELPDGRTVLRGHARPVADDPLDIPAGTRHASPSPTTRAAAPSAPSSSTASSSSSSSSSSKATGTTTKSSTATSASTPSSTSSAGKAKKHHRHKSHPASHGAHPTSTPTGGHA